MSVDEMLCFSVPSDVPPALEYASGLLHNLVDRVSQLEHHQNPHKSLYLTARCIAIFEGLLKSFHEPPPAFEDVAEALGSLSELESLVIEAITVFENEAAPSALTSSHPDTSRRDWT
ncbi:hypothetical protein FRC01_001536, partial [Tulasnella sp. 417]